VLDQPRWITVADLNGDGWLDLFVPQILSDRSFILWAGPRLQHGAAADAVGLPRRVPRRRRTSPATGRSTSSSAATRPRSKAHDSYLYVYWTAPTACARTGGAIARVGAEAIAVADFNRGRAPGPVRRQLPRRRVRDSPIRSSLGGEGGRFQRRTPEPASSCTRPAAVPLAFNEDGWVDLAVGYHKVNNDHLGHSAIWWNAPEVQPRACDQPASLGPHGMMRVGTGNQRDRGRRSSTPPSRSSCRGRREAHARLGSRRAAQVLLRGEVRTAPTQDGLAQAQWRRLVTSRRMNAGRSTGWRSGDQ